MSNKRGIFSVVAGVLFFCCINFSPVLAQQAKTIAIFPFEVLAQDDLAFLGKGLTRMISSRTGDSGEIQVQQRQKSLDSFGIELGPEVLESLSTSQDFAGLDYFVSGSLTVMGTTVSTDAELIDVKQGRVVCTFHESGTSHQDLVRHASVIAERMKTIILGGPIPQVTPETFGSTGSAMLEKRGKSQSIPLPASALSQTAVTGPVAAGAVFRSRTFDTRFSGVACGDVDGDGRSDLVLMDEHSINFFSFENGTLVKKGEFQGRHYETFKAVDVADVNKNKVAEIFVTCVDRKAKVTSLVLEWQQGAFQALVKDSSWYYRVVRVNGDKQLYGQEGGYSEPFSGGVSALDWDGCGYGRQTAVSLPTGVDIFSFVKGDFLGKGADQTLWVDPGGIVNLSASNGKIEWTSPDSFGSTPLFLGERAGQDLEDQERIYINSKMAAADLDRNGQSEAILVHNRDQSRGFLGRFRKFTAGSVKALSWNAAGMQTLWETEQVKGCIADWALEDLDNDGRPELIYCINLDSGTLLTKIRSNVVVEKIE
ncbi:FG-GAP-like repeat-containing protein [Desulforapulum autotrophicum]|nr:FG-GAP-like repeat-containing protein [Desulforapulum autotrophicum]